MIAKKNKKVNLERKRFAFFQIGLLVSGSLCLAAFEWSSASPDEFVQEFKDDGTSVLYEPLVDEDKFQFVKEVQQPKVVNLENLEDIKIVTKVLKTGNVKTTTNQDVIFIPGDDCIDCITDWTIHEPKDDNKIWDVPEVEPSFNGDLAAWLGKNLQFPELPAQMGMSGIAYIQFVVNTDGSIVDVVCAGAPHEDFAREGIRAVSKMPKWNPGEQAGKKVRVRYTLPINFKNI